MTGRVEGKVAVITGGASGFGEASGRLFVQEGAKVVLADVQDERGEAVAADLGPSARFRHCDVTSERDIAGLVDFAMSEFGRLDCMFNNAGIVGVLGPIDEIDLDEYDYTMAVLLRSVFLGMKHAARVMKPQGSGVILSTASIVGVLGGLGPHIYGAAKAGVIHLTRSVAAELGAYGLRACAIVPGKHATPMMADAMFGDPTATDRAAAQLAAAVTPIKGRGGNAADIAHAALWLASDDAGFVSGHALVVDGGLTTGSPENPDPGRGNLARHVMIREAGKRGLS